MHTSARGIALIASFEGFSPTPYLCPAGYLTIGYGHVLLAKDTTITIDESEAMVLLGGDLRHAEQAVTRLITVPLGQEQFDALVSFAFNLGAGALQRSRLRQKVNRGEHAEVPHEFCRWVYAAGRILPGLVARRKAEARLYALSGHDVS